MLNFYNKKIYLDFEMYDSYSEKIIMFCPNPYISKPHSNELHFESLSFNDLINLPYNDVFMTPSQLKSFIHSWINNSDLMVNINYEEWFNDYIHCIKQMSDIMGDFEYTDRNSLFRQRQKWFIDNIELYDVPSPININQKVIPEYSFMIADMLYCKKLYIPTMYQPNIDKIIEINKCKCFEYQNRTNLFGYNYLDFKSYNNCESISDLCYLYFPLSGESINSNFIYIKKCLEKYLEK